MDVLCDVIGDAHGWMFYVLKRRGLGVYFVAVQGNRGRPIVQASGECSVRPTTSIDIATYKKLVEQATVCDTHFADLGFCTPPSFGIPSAVTKHQRVAGP